MYVFATLHWKNSHIGYNKNDTERVTFNFLSYRKKIENIHYYPNKKIIKITEEQNVF